MTSTITTRKSVANAFRTLGCLLLMIGLWTTNANAVTCVGAAVIPVAPSLPYVAALTCGATNDMTSANTTVCGSGSYKGGNEAVFVWTPTSNYTGVSIAYVGVSWTGIFLYNGCPTSGGACLGNITSSGTSKTLTGMTITAGNTYYIVFDTWPTPNSPCAGTMTLNGTISTPCSTPAPGNTVSTANPACSGVNFTLSLQNATSGTGVTYQWYKDAVLVGGATNATYVTSQTAAATYYCDVTCSTGPSTVSSNNLTVTMGSLLNCYCAASHSSCSGDGITNVEIPTTALNYASAGCPGVGNYTYVTPGVSSATLTIGNTYTINITMQTDPTQYCNAWIDFNGDGTLAAGEAVGATYNGAALGTFTFTVPGGAVAGLTRLRVKGGVDGTFTTAQACGANIGSTFGEIEDYDITLAAAAPCSTPAPGNTVASSASICAGGTSNLSLQFATSGTGVSYQWNNTGGAIGGATNSTYTTPALFANETYTCDVTCSTGPSTTTSNPVTITIVASPVGGTATGPATAETYQNLAYNVTGTTGSLQWQFSTTAAAGPYTDIPGATNAALNITANGGATYYVRCKAYNAGCVDDFSNVITTVVTVAGDNVCSANVLALGNNGPYTNAGATTEVGEPAPAATTCADQLGWCIAGISNSVWFSFTPAVSGMYNFGNNGNLSLWDNQFALYSAATCGDLLIAAGTQLAANDDSTISTSPFKAWIASVCLTGGTTYYLQVDGYSTGTNTNWGIRVSKDANVAPVIAACPSDIAQCDNFIATWTDPSATDECGGATVVCSPASGSTFAAGTTSVTCTATDVESATSACSFNVTINVTPVIGACPSDISQCNPVATWTDPTATGTPAATVTCTPASGSSFTVGATTPVTCTASNLCGSSSCSFNVTILSPSTDPTGASSNANYGQICIGGQVTLSVTGGTFGDGAGYVWYEGGCGAGASIGSGASINITPATTGVHTYYARIEGTCNNTNCVSVAVNVISAPPSGTVHYTASIADGCVGAPAAAFSVNAVAGSAFYNWSSSQAGVRFNGNPSPFQTTVPTVNVTFVSLPAAGASGWSICVFGGNACGNTNNICTWVRATVSMPSSITGSVIGCPGTSGNAYSSSTVAGAASYQWSSTGGIVVTGNGAQAVTVAFPGGFVSGTLSVRGQTACGYNGPNRTMTITASPAIPATISGPSYPCPNASASYSIAAVPGAANYTWTTSVPGAVVTGTGTSCSIAFPATIPAGSTVSVVANSLCPTSSATRSKGIASGTPGVPFAINGPASGQCGATGVSYTINPVFGATGYNWTASCGIIQGPNNLSGISIDWPGSFTTCTLSVTATNACGTGIARTLVVFGAPAIPASITGNAAPCANTLEGYSASSVGATSYNWTVPAGATIIGPANGASINVLWGATSGNITVTATNACGTSGVRSLPCVISCRQSQISASASGLNAEVYPNPATEKATVKFSATTSSQYHLNMTDVIGRNVLSTDGTATEGINMVDLDLNNLAKGVYMLNIMSGDNNEQIRVVVE